VAVICRDLAMVAGSIACVLVLLGVKPQVHTSTFWYFGWISAALILLGLSSWFIVSVHLENNRLKRILEGGHSHVPSNPEMIGKAGGLQVRAGEAECLALELEKIWHLYNNDGRENLVRPLNQKLLIPQLEYRHVQLMKFRTLYQWNIDSVKEQDKDFHSDLITHGFPNPDEYAVVRKNLEAHAQLLRDRAKSLSRMA